MHQVLLICRLLIVWRHRQNSRAAHVQLMRRKEEEQRDASVMHCICIDIYQLEGTEMYLTSFITAMSALACLD